MMDTMYMNNWGITNISFVYGMVNYMFRKTQA